MPNEELRHMRECVGAARQRINPFEAICDAWTKDPDAFKINPRHLIPGPNTSDVCPFKG
jgi:hypothetical protein